MTQQEKIDTLEIRKAKREYVKHGLPLSSQLGLMQYIVQHSGVPHRRIGALIGQDSSGFIANVVKGNKRITNKHAVNLAKVCNMSQREKIEFYEGVLNKD